MGIVMLMGSYFFDLTSILKILILMLKLKRFNE